MYTVKIDRTPEGVAVRVRPHPEIVLEEHAGEVSGSIESLIIGYDASKNSLWHRRKLKRELTQLLNDFTEKGWIRPREGP